MRDDPPQEDNLKAKWEKIYRDVCNDLEEPAQQDECLEIGWQRDAYYSNEKLTGHAEMLGTANDFDLDAEESSAEDPSQSADLASSQVGDSMLQKSAGPGDYSFFGEEVTADERLENPQTDMPSSLLQIFFSEDISFNAWQILALLCLVLLMLCGGIVVMDALCRIL